MFNFFIGLIAGVACAALFGWVNYGSEERDALRAENETLRAANQGLTMSMQEAQDATYKARPLAQPAKAVGTGSSRSTKESRYSD